MNRNWCVCHLCETSGLHELFKENQEATKVKPVCSDKQCSSLGVDREPKERADPRAGTQDG